MHSGGEPAAGTSQVRRGEHCDASFFFFFICSCILVENAKFSATQCKRVLNELAFGQ